ncbi:MAG: putative GNAT superfamily acetyltransferase [Acidimicrobiales bacterium]|jgi:predicted GNAT superfamily acetyltransferase
MIRTYLPADAAEVLTLNADNVPEVGDMDASKLALFESMAPFFRVVEVDGKVVGALVGLTEESTAYGSPNYAWFSERHDNFAYIDRVMLAETTRGQGWGPALYDQFAEWATSSDRHLLCAEVNTVPDNPRSIRFHELYGFVEMARCNPYGPDEEVAMFEKWL